VAAFGASAYLAAAAGLFAHALRSATSPRLGRAVAAGDLREIRRLVGVTALLGAIPGLVLAGLAWIAGGELLALLYLPGYGSHGLLLELLGLSVAFAGVTSSLRALMTALDQLFAQVPILLGSLVVTVVVSWLAMAADPLLGAAFGLLAGRMFLTMATAFALYRSWTAVSERAHQR
jgi:O-antigen/teichoic acid export membrane protein